MYEADYSPIPHFFVYLNADINNSSKNLPMDRGTDQNEQIFEKVVRRCLVRLWELPGRSTFFFSKGVALDFRLLSSPLLPRTSGMLTPISLKFHDFRKTFRRFLTFIFCRSSMRLVLGRLNPFSVEIGRGLFLLTQGWRYSVHFQGWFQRQAFSGGCRKPERVQKILNWSDNFYGLRFRLVRLGNAGRFCFEGGILSE
jgi:hypothetical protein